MAMVWQHLRVPAIPRVTIARSRLLVLVLGTVLCAVLPFAYFRPELVSAQTAFRRPKQPYRANDRLYPYRWPHTPLPPLPHGTVDDCSHFPTAQLQHVQAVLKTGHSTLERVKSSLNTTSACLEGLLIFSDTSENVLGRPVVDVIADIPENSRQRPAFAYYNQLHQPNSSYSRDEAWSLDRFKFLPGISRAWKESPDKQWYVFYEGDTTVVWNTIIALLSEYDPDDLHYFGNPSPRLDIHFGNGGSGYILSRAAMKMLVKKDWTWLGEWQPNLAVRHLEEVIGDPCGDSVLGKVLWDQGVPLQGLWPLFNPHPLHGIPFSNDFWCQPVASLHKTQPEHMLAFWQWELTRESRYRPSMYRDIAISFWQMGTLDRRYDWDNGDWGAYRPSETDPYGPDESADNCAKACELAKGGGCFQWTFHLRTCYFVNNFRLGKAKGPKVEKQFANKDWSLEDQRFIAGWNNKRILEWIAARPCDTGLWVKPDPSPGPFGYHLDNVD